MSRLTANLILICTFLILASFPVNAILVADFESATIPYAFTALNDTPSSYTGFGLYSVVVNVAEDALQFLDVIGLISNSSINESFANDTYVNVAGDRMEGDLYGLDIYPNESLTYDLGSGANRWDWLYVRNISTEDIEAYNIYALTKVSSPLYCTGSDCFNLSQLNNSFGEYLPLTGGTLSGNLDMGTNDIDNVINMNITDKIYKNGQDDTYIDFGNDRIQVYVDGKEAMDYYGATASHFIHIGHDDSFKVRIAADTLVVNGTTDFVQVNGDLNATGIICDSTGCIGGINETFANETYVLYTGATNNVDLGTYNLTTTENIIANYFIGNGSQLTDINYTETDPLFIAENSTLARIGVCPIGTIVQNTTLGGVECLNLSTIYYNATQSEAIAGTIDGGTLNDTQHQDGSYDGITFNFTEVVASPGLDLRINFTNIEAFNRGLIRYKTSELKGDFPVIQLWDYGDLKWEDYPTLAESVVFATTTQPVFDDSEHINVEGTVQMRLYKESTGNSQNHYYVDWVSISKGLGTPSGEEVDPYWEQDKEDYYNTTKIDLLLNNGTILHNNTGNLQGGTATNEYYHLNESEHTSVLAGITSWITNTVNDLTNYYLKTETYNQTEVYNRTETYNNTEVYNKTETYNITEVYNTTEIDDLLSPKLTVENVARSIYVDVDATGAEDGTSWTDAFTTLQDGVDDVGNVIDGVVITIYIRGVYDDFEEEETIVAISKSMIGGGQLYIRADEYIGGNNVVSSTASTVVFAGTEADDFWNDCYTFIYTGVGDGQVRKITDSATSGGSTTLTITPDWDTNPTVGNKLAVAGRARFSQADFGFGFTEVGGVLNNVKFAGLAFYDFGEAETSILTAGSGARVVADRCVWWMNTAGGSMLSSSIDSWNSASVCGFYNTSASSVVQCYGCNNVATYQSCFDGASNDAIWVNFAGKADVAYMNFNRITNADVYAVGNSAVLVYSPTGTDGGVYGIRAETGAQVEVSGGSLSESADAATFAYIS